MRQHRVSTVLGLASTIFVLVILMTVLAMPAAAQERVSAAARKGFTVKLLDPVDNAIVFGESRIVAQVQADDPSQILEVAFYVDDEKIFVDREGPFQTVHDFGAEPRSVVVRAVATHIAGFTVEHTVVTRRLQLSYAVEVRRVALTLTVVDGSGIPVTGLARENFRVTENGEPQQILEFSVEERPLRIAMVVDTSGSMRQKLTEVQLAATDFLEVLRPQDRAMVVDFDDQVLLLQDLTDSKDDLRAALMSTFPRGGTAMYDAVHATLRRLGPQDERKAIILLSDGGDTASVMDKDRSMEAARSSEVIIYGIGIGGADKSVLKSLSKEAGGRAFFAAKATELAGIYKRIAEELRNQYVLTYSSSNPEYDGKWRKIDVDYVGKGSFKVRTRAGYYAVRTSSSPLDRPLMDPAVVTPPAPDPDSPDQTPAGQTPAEADPTPAEDSPDPESSASVPAATDPPVAEPPDAEQPAPPESPPS